MDKPKKKTHVFQAGQVEEHEIGLIFEEVQCYACGGGGEIVEDDYDGMEYRDDCSECNGSGVVYISI
jgi:DnaJ-class molecular chaperone